MGNVCKECGEEKGHYENCPFCDNSPEECGCPGESEFVQAMVEYYAGLDWQQQQELIRKLDKYSQVPMFEHNE